MKGKPEVHEVLAKMLKEELGAISEYFIHAEMCENWGYKKLSDHTKKESINEMKHAEKLIERILFLNGTPNLNDMPKLAVGKDVKQQFENDLARKERRGRVQRRHRRVPQGRRPGFRRLASENPGRRRRARGFPGRTAWPHRANRHSELPRAAGVT